MTARKDGKPADAKRRTARRRKYLGKTVGFGTRQKVYAISEGLEIDEQDVNEIVRRRVFFDDVSLVTYHRFFGWGFLLVTGLAGVAFTALAAGVGSAEPVAGYVLFICIAAPFWLVFALRLIFRVDVVTVFGRRTKAVMRFSFRKRRAREVFDWVCEKTREKLAQPAAESAEEGGGESPGEDGGESTGEDGGIERASSVDEEF